MEERINKIFIMLDKYCKEKDLFKQLDIPSLDFDKTKQLEKLLNLKKDDLRDEIANELIWLREKMIQTNRTIVYR
jgi:hypothetical protein